MTFRVELSEIAEAEIDALFLRMNGWNPNVAGRWLEKLTRAIDKLAIFPTSHPVTPESDVLGGEVRRMLYKHGNTTYRVLFRLLDEDQDNEPETVLVLHIRHGAQQLIGEEAEGF